MKAVGRKDRAGTGRGETGAEGAGHPTGRETRGTRAGTASYAAHFLDRAAQVLAALEPSALDRMAQRLQALREGGGRLFVLGVGGSAANAAHAVNDFRKLAGLEAYAPTDNVAELTARTNDEGWETVFAAWLEGSRLSARDAVLVLSVGGGDAERGISANLVRAVQYARARGALVCALVGRDGGYAARHADHCVVVPPVDGALITPLTEAFQALLWHLLVTHPALRRHPGKWESEAGSTGGMPDGGRKREVPGRGQSTRTEERTREKEDTGG